MSDLIESMRRHVASYKTLTMHRMQCLELCDEVERLTSQLESGMNGQSMLPTDELNKLIARNKVLEDVLRRIARNPDCEWASCGVSAREAIAAADKCNHEWTAHGCNKCGAPVRVRG